MVIIGSGIRRELAVHRSTSRISTGGKPGNQPFQGVLLIGGDARLSHVRGIPALGLSNANGQSSSQNLPDLTFLDEGTGTGLDLGPVQAIHLTMSHPGRCASNYSAEQTLPPPFLGQSQVIAGQADAPVQRQWRLGWWSGPRSSQSWPLVGDFPGVSFNDLGEFRALSGLSGAWIRPGRQYIAVSAGGLQPRALVDYARPQPSTATGLDWDSAEPLQPIAVVTNTTAMNAWQNWLVAAGILLGIGGALLASLLFEWARPSRQPNPAQEPTPQSPTRPYYSQPTGHRLTKSAIGLLLTWVVITRRHRS